MKTELKTCICCGNLRPALTQFKPGAPICIHCEDIDPYDLARRTLETANIAHATATQTKAGRKAARVARRQAAYTQHGKRCASCHHTQPIALYGVCAPAPDGLQANCKPCTRIRCAMYREPNGRAAWYAYRDAMRAKAANATR